MPCTLSFLVTHTMDGPQHLPSCELLKLNLKLDQLPLGPPLSVPPCSHSLCPILPPNVPMWLLLQGSTPFLAAHPSPHSFWTSWSIPPVFLWSSPHAPGKTPAPALAAFLPSDSYTWAAEHPHRRSVSMTTGWWAAGPSTRPCQPSSVPYLITSPVILTLSR